MPSWKPPYILLSIVLISYPVAWLVIGWGLSRFWQNAGLKECFVLGWALGCTALTLSGPFYPYPDRGAITLQIALYVLAGAIYFSRYRRVNLAAAITVVVLLGVTPLWTVAQQWNWTGFRTGAPFMFLSKQHQDLIDTVRRNTTANDILLADPRDLLWLAPEYPGIHYCGHFFLTVDYERKLERLNRFFKAASEQKREFLLKEGIRFIFVGAGGNLEPYRSTPGLKVLTHNEAGSVLEFQPGG